MTFDQASYQIRCEWGERGVRELESSSDTIIIVDVLSFSTCVDIATANGALVYPFGKKDDAAQVFADEIGGILASQDRKSGGFSLSPQSLLSIQSDTKLVLPSPNGSTLSLATGDCPTYAGCLRNAKAVANTAQEHGPIISVIPAGERWKDDRTLRPSLEDLLGAGAIIHYLSGNKSPEAIAAEMTFLHFKDLLFETLQAIGSGRELIEKDSIEDVQLASQLNSSQVAPMLKEGVCYSQ